ncbi:hypothetical protein D6851_12630 [Altericroceibacterium spongiae]|uniref:Uncharacterized protein n=1 Tax=Altericroceibacterium spongiae TaxID=2320269 RepID=A0A420EF19_9SPHN|nr:hypothetical protein [Altericroceibacterium spongiae]RKF19299.1 hypothetical protein D6851_12630 [Altericroceibacterium spongiae]
MVEFLPFLLILVGWETADPQGSMEMRSTLVESEEACEAKGMAFMDRQEKEAAYSQGLEGFRYFCVRAPDSEDFDALFEQLK